MVVGVAVILKHRLQFCGLSDDDLEVWMSRGPTAQAHQRTTHTDTDTKCIHTQTRRVPPLTGVFSQGVVEVSQFERHREFRAAVMLRVHIA